MIPQRKLPQRVNPLIQPNNTPSFEELVDRRRLGQTQLEVSRGQVGLSNATKKDNLGEFNYVHLRAPLPKDLSGSGVFVPTTAAPLPTSYFLMRRCSDGFISATGLFKCAYPWISRATEESEKQYIMSLPGAAHDEVAGNVWVSPELALVLSEEYNILSWVEALLDNRKVLPQSSVEHRRIPHPPPFHRPLQTPTSSPSTKAGSMSTKKRNTSRDLRSASPVKQPAPPTPSDRPKATPRKPRAKTTPDADASKPAKQSKKEKKADKKVNGEAERELKEELAEEQAIADAAAAAEAIATVNGEPAAEPLPEGAIRVTVKSDVEDNNDVETTHTTVKVELPADAPDLELPVDTEGVIAKAREIVADIKEMQEEEQKAKEAGSSAKSSPTVSSSKSNRKNLKRKADEAELELEGPEELVHEVVEPVVPVDGSKGSAAAALAAQTSTDASPTRPTKRARVMVPAEEFRRERVKRRALVGISASLAVGAIIPFLSNLF